ncbi:ATP-dependent RecD-like DNA helicase [Tumebacillus algifaecis]|uniref:ATP-dependent RecD2 DNA helicase n=1 Tax=Tumebacillus algifaecis TaxID=1214604 RepID=A0A223CX78_9BACL|nr:ATP-dependent RecD-like DNA helicase [Tumebacillus algifaecis]ASS73916.1 ATP-dependent RecD-like DNA helicase [Tumebacillus algifaecis]
MRLLPEERVTLEGKLKKITYHNEENGYTVATLQTGKKDSATVVGTMFGPQEGDNVRVTGKWSRHEKWGPQLVIEDFERVLPVTAEAILSFLSSGTIKGLGPKTAKKLVEQFGEKTLQVIESEPERLQMIEGIGQKKAEGIAQGLREQLGVQSVMVYLGSRGITPSIAAKIYKRYGAEAVDVLRSNPYRLVDEVRGIGFKTADKLALQLGLPPDSPSRLRAALKHVLRQGADEGHVFLPESEVLGKAEGLLGSQTRDQLPMILQGLAAERTGGVIIEPAADNRVYLAGFYFAELKSAEKIRVLMNGGVQFTDEATDENEMESLIETVEAEQHMELAQLQRQAVAAVLRERLVIITGGPGTGKTTTVKAMIAALERQGVTPTLAAPTGRAAKRMTESTGVEAKTLHRLLEYAMVEGEGLRFQRDEDNPLEGAVFIIDEASMIDQLLFFQLLRALPSGARLVLCGDIDQLPSVGAGRVLQDLIESGVVTVVRLQTIFRQAEESLIVKNAHRINHGLLPEVTKEGDFFFLEEGRPDALLALVLDLAARRLPSYLKADPVEDIQVLVPMRRGAVGVEALNEALQTVLNPPAQGKAEWQQGGRLFRVGDKVMQTKNNYNKEVFNGDVGRVAALDAEEGELVVAYADDNEPRLVTYAPNELDELSLAYAVTVHKSQGSEYPCVILPVVTQHRVMLQRNLLYTGVTRAKKLVVLVGTKSAVQLAVRSQDGQRRHTWLAERIRSVEEGPEATI